MDISDMDMLMLESMSMEEAVVVAIDMAVVVADPIDMEVVIPDMSIIVKKLHWWSDVQAEVVLSERRVFVRGC